MPITKQTLLDPHVLIEVGAGEASVGVPETPLRRLNYFDGKFLRSSDLQLEQRYLRSLVEISNQAGGSGIVHGFSVRLAQGDGLTVGPGLAIDVHGRVLLLQSEQTLSITTLIEASRQIIFLKGKQQRGGTFADCDVVTDVPVFEPLRRAEVYVISVSFAEALCGEEDVYGKICEQACITDTARPYWVEGVRVRARPLDIDLPAWRYASVAYRAQTHLRNRIASAYFAREATHVPHFISGDGLINGTWCAGALPEEAREVDIAVIARHGQGTLFLDPWTVRRERIEAPPRKYWAWRMRMRPWDVFLAQVLQFQCQLSRLFSTTHTVEIFDACAPERELLKKTARTIKAMKAEFQKSRGLEESYLDALRFPHIPDGAALSHQFAEFLKFDEEVNAVLRSKRFRRSSRILIDGGFVELPSAGYLPVDLHSRQTVQEQVRQLMGQGVDLRFCAVRTDFVAHALEEAQHMDRIDLVQGLDDPSRKTAVDILVPDATIDVRPKRPVMNGYHVGIMPFATPIPTKQGEFLPDIPNPRGYNLAPTAPQIYGGVIGGMIESSGQPAPEAERAQGGNLLRVAGLDPSLQLITSILGHGGRISGAGRAELRPEGGGSFQLAGMTDVRRGQFTMFDAALGATEMMADSRAAKSAPAPSIGDRFDAVAEAMRTTMAHNAGGGERIRRNPQSSSFPGDALEAIMGGAAPGGARSFPETWMSSAGLSATRGKGGIALWSLLEAQANPFDLQTDAETTFSLRVVLGRGSTAPTTTDLTVEGKLIVRQKAHRVGTIPTVKCLLDARASMEITRADGTSIELSAPLRQLVTLESYDRDGTEAVRITVPIRGFKLVALVAWPGIRELHADAELYLGMMVDSAPLYLGGAGFIEDPGVFDERSPFHTLAVNAIDFIGEVLPEPDFAERAKKNLFAPVLEGDPDLLIQPTRDWVLFTIMPR